MDYEENDNEKTMIDRLAYDCTQLMDRLSGYNTDDDIDNILAEYLKKADKAYDSIDDFKEDLDWFNVTEPLSLADTLRGKIVILDFFTYCCINCMHILPDLKQIEDLYSVETGLVVIGVHSAKFDNEKDSANILSAVQRYNITHPVVNDGQSSLWTDLNIQCWPTLLILGPNGNPLFVLMGEGHGVILEKYITATMNFYKENKLLKNHSLPLNPATDLMMTTNLKFPGKIVCSKMNGTENKSELYALSDSGNHRILIINSRGDVLQKIGGKTSGFVDGNLRTARFNSPQGVCFLNNDILFVADTENHAIRKIDLKNKYVETVAGTGQQGVDRVGGKKGKAQVISSPWDVACYRTRDMDMSFHVDESNIPVKDVLLIAMAGTHQIWCLFLDDVIWWKFKRYASGTCVAIAGRGDEENKNNIYPHIACFAQPSGLALSKDTKELFLADSESSTVRKVCLTTGKVMGVVGGDRNPKNLFSFGDVDGKSFAGKLQHPLGIAYNPKLNKLYVADTYNHKIKQIDPVECEITTLKIKDNGGLYQFNEPGGLCFSPDGSTMFVADTNNHVIGTVNLTTLRYKTLALNFDVTPKNTELGKILNFGSHKINPQGGKVRFMITLQFDDGVHFTENAPQIWNTYLPNDSWYINEQNGNIKSSELLEQQNIELEITVPSAVESSIEHNVTVTFKLSLCANQICFPKVFSLLLPFIYDTNGLDCIIEEAVIKVNEADVTL